MNAVCVRVGGVALFIYLGTFKLIHYPDFCSKVFKSVTMQIYFCYDDVCIIRLFCLTIKRTAVRVNSHIEGREKLHLEGVIFIIQMRQENYIL